MVNIEGLDKAAVLKALHDGTRAMGMGMLHDLGRDLTLAEARQLIGSGDDVTRMYGRLPGDRPLSFDYVCGRPLKVDISGDEFDEWGYDRDAGQGRAESVIAALRANSAAA